MTKIQQSKDGTIRVVIPKVVATNSGFEKGTEVEVKSDDRCGGANIRKVESKKAS